MAQSKFLVLKQTLRIKDSVSLGQWRLWEYLHVEYTVESVPHMEIVQIVLDKKLLQAADQAAQLTKQNRSALVRDALREHLRRIELRASEERDRQGYSRQSPADAEARGWESEATWPEE